MTSLASIGFTLAGGSLCGFCSLCAFACAQRSRSVFIAPRCTARPRDTIYTPRPKMKSQERGSALIGWVWWSLRLSYDEMLQGVRGTGTRENGRSGDLLKVNMDAIVLFRFHAVGLRVSALATVLAVCVILPLNWTAECGADVSGENLFCVKEQRQDVPNSYERTTLNHIPPVESGKEGNYIFWTREDFPSLMRFYTIVACSWILTIYSLKTLVKEWVEILALRRVYYLEANHYQNRKKELEKIQKVGKHGETNMSRISARENSTRRDIWIPHPEQRDTVPNIELYSVLVGGLPNLPSEVVEDKDIEAAERFSKIQAIDWQLAVATSFFDHGVPNQPGFSSSVAAISILPDAPELARAWRKWYVAAAALRRLRFIRSLIADLRFYDIEICDSEDDAIDGGIQGVNVNYSKVTAANPKKNKTKTKKQKHKNSFSSTSSSNETRQTSNYHRVFGGDDQEEVESILMQAMNYGPEQTAVYSREFAQGAACCCPHGCNEERLRDAPIDELIRLEKEALAAVEAADISLRYARELAAVSVLEGDNTKGEKKEKKEKLVRVGHRRGKSYDDIKHLPNELGQDLEMELQLINQRARANKTAAPKPARLAPNAVNLAAPIALGKMTVSSRTPRAAVSRKHLGCPTVKPIHRSNTTFGRESRGLQRTVSSPEGTSLPEGTPETKMQEKEEDPALTIEQFVSMPARMPSTIPPPPPNTNALGLSMYSNPPMPSVQESTHTPAFNVSFPILANNNSVSHGTVSHGTVSHGTVSHGTVSHGTVSHGTVSHGTVSHGTVSHGTGSHGTISNSTPRMSSVSNSTPRMSNALTTSSQMSNALTTSSQTSADPHTVNSIFVPSVAHDSSQSSLTTYSNVGSFETQNFTRRSLIRKTPTGTDTHLRGTHNPMQFSLNSEGKFFARHHAEEAAAFLPENKTYPTATDQPALLRRRSHHANAASPHNSVRSLTDEPSDQWRQVEHITSTSHEDSRKTSTFDGVWERPTVLGLIQELLKFVWDITRWPIRKTGKAVGELSRSSSYAVVTFTSRQAAVAARHCLGDGRGANRWRAISSLPIPPLADAAPCDLKTCRGCCRPVTLSINPKQQMVRKYLNIILLTSLYIFYVFPIAFASAMIDVSKVYEIFPSFKEFTNQYNYIDQLYRGIITALLLTLFFALCPLMFRGIANSGSNASSVHLAERAAMRYYWWFMVVTAFTGSTLLSLITEGFNEGKINIDLNTNSFRRIIIVIAGTIPGKVSATWINWIILRTTVILPMQYLLQVNTFMFMTLKWKCLARAVMGGGPGGALPYRVYIDSGVVFMCTVALSVASPIVAPCSFFYFLVCQPLWRRNSIFTYRPRFDGGGMRWPFLFDVFISSIIVGQVLLVIMLSLKGAYGAAVMAFVPIVPTLIFRKSCRSRFFKPFMDCGLLQTSLLDHWENEDKSTMRGREEFRRFLVDCHKAAYIPVCIAGEQTNILTAEPAVVTPKDSDMDDNDITTMLPIEWQPKGQSLSKKSYDFPHSNVNNSNGSANFQTGDCPKSEALDPNCTTS